MDCLEKNEVAVVAEMATSACGYGTVHSVFASKFDKCVCLEIVMHTYADNMDIHDIRCLKQIPIREGFKVYEINSDEEHNTIEFTFSEEI